MKKLVIATRGSALALWQANHIKALLQERHLGLDVELLVLKTRGDVILDVPKSGARACSSRKLKMRCSPVRQIWPYIA